MKQRVVGGLGCAGCARRSPRRATYFLSIPAMRCRKRASCSSVSSKSVFAVCTPVYRRHATVIKTGLAFDRLGKPTRWRLPLEGEDGLNRSGRSTRRQREFDPSPIDVDYVSGGPHRRAVRCLDVLLPPPEGARSGAGHTK